MNRVFLNSYYIKLSEVKHLCLEHQVYRTCYISQSVDKLFDNLHSDDLYEMNYKNYAYMWFVTNLYVKVCKWINLAGLLVPKAHTKKYIDFVLFNWSWGHVFVGGECCNSMVLELDAIVTFTGNEHMSSSCRRCWS